MSRRDAPIGPASSVSEWMAAVAHEIGTPMTTILGYAELLAKSASDEKSRQRAVTIVEQVQRVSELFERLLALSRAGADAGAAPVALAALVESALAACADALARRGLRVEQQLAAVPPVLAESARLESVLVQLLLAAIEATPRDGTLCVALGANEDGEVELRVAQSEGSVGGSTGDATGVRFRLALPVVR